MQEILPKADTHKVNLTTYLSGSARGEQYYCPDCYGSALPGKILPFSPLAASGS